MPWYYLRLTYLPIETLVDLEVGGDSLGLRGGGVGDVLSLYFGAVDAAGTDSACAVMSSSSADACLLCAPDPERSMLPDC